jgi:hypothetical protein
MLTLLRHRCLIVFLRPNQEHSNSGQAKTAQPGSPVAPPATMATSWAAGIIVSEMTAS